MAKFQQQIKIDAPMDHVWKMMLNPATWTSWFPNIDSISGLTTVQKGVTFQWKDDDKSGTGTIAELDHDRGLLTVVITGDGEPTTHTFDLDRAGGFFGLGGNDTKLTYEREYDPAGGFLGEFIKGGNPADSMQVKQVVKKIKQLAQG